jgi:hypothetical protein
VGYCYVGEVFVELCVAQLEYALSRDGNRGFLLD